MNHPLATLTDEFLKERRYLKNVTAATLIWYEVVFKSCRDSFAPGGGTLPIKTSLQQFVISLRRRNLRPVTCNTYIGAMNAFHVWLHAEGHATERIKLSKLRGERRVLELLDERKCACLSVTSPKTFSAATMSPIGAERHAASGCAQRCYVSIHGTCESLQRRTCSPDACHSSTGKFSTRVAPTAPHERIGQLRLVGMCIAFAGAEQPNSRLLIRLRRLSCTCSPEQGSVC
jgi:hypothetical protein